MNNIYHIIDSKFRTQVRDEIDIQLYDQIYKKIYWLLHKNILNELDTQISIEIDSPIYWQLLRQLRDIKFKIHSYEKY